MLKKLKTLLFGRDYDQERKLIVQNLVSERLKEYKKLSEYQTTIQDRLLEAIYNKYVHIVNGKLDHTDLYKYGEDENGKIVKLHRTESEIGHLYSTIIDEQLFKVEYENILTDMPPDASSDVTIKTILDNEFNYWCSTVSTASINKSITLDLKFLINSTYSIIKQLINLKGLISIQPMKGPIGLSFSLDVVELSESPGQFSIQLKKYTTEASTRMLRTRVNVETIQDIKIF